MSKRSYAFLKREIQNDVRMIDIDSQIYDSSYVANVSFLGVKVWSYKFQKNFTGVEESLKRKRKMGFSTQK